LLILREMQIKFSQNPQVDRIEVRIKQLSTWFSNGLLAVGAMSKNLLGPEERLRMVKSYCQSLAEVLC
jgi:hypothetical protein